MRHQFWIGSILLYPGIEATIAGCFKNTRTRFCIDSGIGDAAFSRRKRNFSTETLTRMLGFRRSESMQRMWNAYTERIGLDNIAFDEILKTIGLFISEPFLAAVSGSAFTLDWNPDSMEWR